MKPILVIRQTRGLRYHERGLKGIPNWERIGSKICSARAFALAKRAWGRLLGICRLSAVSEAVTSVRVKWAEMLSDMAPVYNTMSPKRDFLEGCLVNSIKSILLTNFRLPKFQQFLDEKS